MRTVRFFFTDVLSDERARDCARELLAVISGVQPFDVVGELLFEGQAVVGVEIAGECEFVSMASERIRRELRDRALSFREEDHNEPGVWEAGDRALFEGMLGRSAAVAGGVASGGGNGPLDRGDRDEVGEYDLDAFVQAEYGQYPMSGGAHGSSHRRPVSDALLRAARAALAPGAELELPSRRPLSAEERRHLTFVRSIKSGIAFFRLGLFEDAERRLCDALKAHRASPETCFYLGLVCAEKGQLDEAERYLRRAVALDPEVGASHFYLANVLHRQKRLDRAVDAYKRSIELDPDVAIVYNNLAWVFYQLEQHEHALRAFSHSITVDPDLPFSHNGIACVYQDLGAFEEAMVEYRKAIELFPEYAAAWLKLGWCQVQMGAIDAAIESFQAILKAEDESDYASGAWYSLGYCFLVQDRLVEAQDAFARAIDDDESDFVDALLNLGIIQLRLGFARQAVTLIRRYLRKVETGAVSDGPGADHTSGESLVPLAWRRLARALFESGQYGAAAKACTRALQFAGEEAEILDLMGQIAIAQKRWKVAERHLRRSLEVDGVYAPAWLHLGEVLEHRNDRDEAMAAYKRAISQNPVEARSYFVLGRLFVREGRREEALVLMEKAAELAPGEGSILGHLGSLYAGFGKVDEARRCLERGLAVDPENAEIHASLGALHQQIGQRDEAETDYGRALALAKEASTEAVAHLGLGSLSRVRQNPTGAREHLEQAVRADPGLSVAWYALAEVQAELGDEDGPRGSFERYLALEPEGERAEVARQWLLEKPASGGTPATRCRRGERAWPRRVRMAPRKSRAETRKKTPPTRQGTAP